jgi:hypothetical protein
MVTLCDTVNAAQWSPTARMRTHAKRTHQYSGSVELQAGIHYNTGSLLKD